METMYNTSMQLHFGLILVWMGVIAFNAAMVQFAVQAPEYVRRARVAMPFSVMAIAAMAFTGTIMMVTVMLIVLEARRYKTLRRIRTKLADALTLYRPYALKLLAAEFALTLLMTVWMLML